MARTKLSVLKQPEHQVFTQLLIDLKIPLTSDFNALRRYLPSIFNGFCEVYCNELEAIANPGWTPLTPVVMNSNPFNSTTSTASSSRQTSPSFTSTSSSLVNEKGKGREIIPQPKVIPIPLAIPNNAAASTSQLQLQSQNQSHPRINQLDNKILEAKRVEEALRAQADRDKWYYEQGILAARHEERTRRAREEQELLVKAQLEKELREKFMLKVTLRPRSIAVEPKPTPEATVVEEEEKKQMISIAVQVDSSFFIPSRLPLEPILNPKLLPIASTSTTTSSKLLFPTYNAPLSPPDQRQVSRSPSPLPATISNPILSPIIVPLTTNNLAVHTSTSGSTTTTTKCTSPPSHITICSDLTTLSELTKKSPPLLLVKQEQSELNHLSFSGVVGRAPSVISDLSDLTISDSDSLAEAAVEGEKDEKKKILGKRVQQPKSEGKREFGFWIEVPTKKKIKTGV